MNSHALFLEHRVAGDEVDVQTGRQRNRPERAVRCQRHIVSFCHPGNFVALGDAARMREVRLQDRNPARFKHAFKLEAREHTFTRRDGNVGLFSQFWIVFRLLGQHRLFDKQRAIRLQLFNQHFGHRRADAAVEIQAKLNFVAKGFTDLRHGVDRPVYRTRVVDNAHLFAAVELEGVKADVAQLRDAVDHFRRTVAAHPAVGFDFVAHQAAHELPDRRVQHFTFDIPQRLVDTGDGAHQDRTTAVEARAVHHLPQVINARRILTNQVFTQLVHRRFNGARAPFNHRFAPAHNPFIGFDFQEHPARG